MKSTSFLLLSLLLLATGAWADDPYCLVPRDVDTTGQRWNRNTNVRVWIAPSVLADLHDEILNAVHSWGNDPRNTTGVVFTFVSTEPVTGNDVLIFRQAPLASPAQYSMDPITKRATIVLNSGITDPLAAQQTAVHEVGHTYGTLDCWQCEAGTSVMVERPADLNDTNSLLVPTECDIAAALLGMGATRTVEETRLPQADNEPCVPVYYTMKFCWYGDCQQLYSVRPAYVECPW